MFKIKNITPSKYFRGNVHQLDILDRTSGTVRDFLKLVEQCWCSRSTPALCWGSKLFSGASTGRGGRLLLSRWHSWQTDEPKFNEALVHEQTTSALIAHNKILPAGAVASITPPKRQRRRYFYLRRCSAASRTVQPSRARLKEFVAVAWRLLLPQERSLGAT